MKIARLCHASARYGALLALLCANACSGESSDAGTGPKDECLTSFAPVDPTALIDDMEDGNSLLFGTANRNGSWWVVGDGTPGGTLQPPSDQAPPPERVPGGHCGSNFAMRVTGQGFTSWGASLSASFRYTSQSESIDASAYRGVRFWARMGDTNSSEVRVQFQDVNTRPEGGICNPEDGNPDSCYDGFGTSLNRPADKAATDWTLYELDFSSMTQRDFGYGGDALDVAHLYDIEWNVDASSIFDLWIDDVWFYK